ncbi:MAG TPA: S1 RNA-binding domain-containing protein [Vicinamibacterales bacterium]|nr:S1 RNA-binding domain-containing protein [Vicinamibacterales bacterium]
MEEEEDFAALFEASGQAKRFRNGQTIEGTIVAIGPEVAFVSVGGKGEATIDVEELKDDEGDIEVSVGDRIQATVVSNAGGLTLSRKLALGAANAEQLEDAFRAGLPVEGKIESVNKGGYEVRVARLRAFCPLSQIDTMRTEDPAVHVGRVYAFRIIEFRDGGQKFVVSRRALLEQDQVARAVELRKSIAVGDVVIGRVVSVRDFGAFVDLGAGVQGLLHVSEMAWARVSDTSEVVKAGDEITVKVLRVDEATQQIALGLKQLSADPWTRVQGTYEVGQVLPGHVTRVMDFGAFVELEPGVEALAHMSTFAPTGRSGGWSKTIPPGMSGMFEILSIDLEKKRIGVAMVEEGSAKAGAVSGEIASSRSGVVPGARMTGKVERHESFGVFVFLAPGRTGLMPFSETGVDKGADIKKALPVGSDVEVIVLEADPAGRRIRVSHKAVGQAQEAAEVREYAQREEAAQTQSFGSLADKLRGALKPRR